ncbi:MAG TPA: hypothetical protein VKR06_18885 [Ktedonosporobacter sp.]|nr:hypothetical protein [Ktedonosporobacter sp.]
MQQIHTSIPASSPTLTSLVEETSLPKIILKARGGEVQLQAYVNAYIVGEREVFMNGTRATPLYYLSLVGMRGQGTTLQGVFARLTSTHSKGIWLEGVGEVALAHHQSSLSECGYTLHWNFEQAEVQPTHDLHAVIESQMLTMCDPLRGTALKQREQRIAKNGAGKKQRAQISLSTAKSSKVQQDHAEIRNREKHPLFLLMVPGWAGEHAHVLHQFHLSFLDQRVPWPLDPSWAGFLWERGREQQEIERLKVWCYTPPASEVAEEEGAEPKEETPGIPFCSEAYFCRPRPAQIQRDVQEALVSGRISSLVHSHLVVLPMPTTEQEEEEHTAIATAV